MDNYGLCVFCDRPFKDGNVFKGEWILTDFDLVKDHKVCYICPECQKEYDNAVNNLFHKIQKDCARREIWRGNG